MGEKVVLKSFDGVLEYQELVKRNRQYVDVDISVRPGPFTDNDKAFLAHVLDAADVMGELFWRQGSVEGPDLKRRLGLAPELGKYAVELMRYLLINAGPYDRLDAMKPFIGQAQRAMGGTFYPPDLTREQFEEWVKAHPADKAAFTSPYTVITRAGADLKAVPYSDYYRPALTKAAESLKKAAEVCPSESLKKFLLSRAAAFLSNDYRPSDGDWVDVKNSPFEITIGPYEVYEDGLMNYKAAFEAFVTVTDPKLTADLASVKDRLAELEENLPLDAAFRGYKRASDSPIFAVDLVYATGDAGKGVQTIAFNLPNDEDVREKKGSKKVMLRNVINAKFEQLLMPLARKMVADDQLLLVKQEDFFWHALLHEISHGMGPGKIKLADGSETTVNLALKDTYPALEEAKADVLGVLNALWLAGRGFFPEKDRGSSMLTTFLAGFFRSVRFGVHEAHGQANLVIFNYLTEKGAYVHDPAAGRWRVDEAKAPDAFRALAGELLLIQAKGDYTGAKAFLSKYGAVSAEVTAALEGLKDIPVDLHPIYSTVPVVRGPGAN
jgi:hypothetical protein